MTSPVRKCLLCRFHQVEPIDRLTGRELRALWRVSGNDLSDQALGQISSTYEVILSRCPECGFRQYDPVLAGDARFYEELMSDREYPTTSPEFSIAVDFAKKQGLSRVLDVGCGEGVFLDCARAAGLITYGMELNPVAYRKTEAKGHPMFKGSLEEMTAESMGTKLDLITLFQVVEHVSSPVDFVKSAANLLPSGAFLFVAVPSEKRMLGLLHHDPANWPPHHVTRWRRRDFESLARQCRLDLVRTGVSTLTASGIRWAWKVHDDFATVMKRPRLPGGKWLPSVICTLYRFSGAKHWLGCHGLSIHAIFRKP